MIQLMWYKVTMMRHRATAVVGFLCTVLNAFDAWATLKELACGAAVEANPIMASSFPTFIAMKLLATGWIAFLLAYRWHKWARVSLWVGFVVYACIAAYHAFGLIYCL